MTQPAKMEIPFGLGMADWDYRIVQQLTAHQLKGMSIFQ
jgi:hypothetical protein